jgi:hypothetical protein
MKKRINLLLMASTGDILRIVEEESYDVKEYFNLLKNKDTRYYEHFLHGGGFTSFELKGWFAKSLIEYEKTGIASDKLKRKILSYIKKEKKEYLEKNQKNEENNTLPNKKEGYIYLIKSQNLYKIGRAKKIKDRIRAYKTENPFGIEILLQVKVDNYIKEENMLLDMFKEKKVRGEWFSLNEEDVELIKEIYEI